MYLLSFFFQNSVSHKLLYLILQTDIQREVQCIPIHCPLISQDRMQQFITKATKIAWSLVTAVPPLVPSCDECDFFEGLHEKANSWDDECSTKCKLKYIHPVLYTSSIGAVTQKGSVRNAKSDGGKQIL